MVLANPMHMVFIQNVLACAKTMAGQLLMRASPGSSATKQSWPDVIACHVRKGMSVMGSVLGKRLTFSAYITRVGQNHIYAV